MYHFITTIPCNYHIKNSISGRNSIVEVCTNYDVYSMPGGVARVCVTHEKTIWWQSRPRAAI